MKKSWLLVLACALASCAPTQMARPVALHPASTSENVCVASLKHVENVMEQLSSTLPVGLRGIGQTNQQCTSFIISVVGFVDPQSLRNLLAEQHIQAEIDVILPPKLQPKTSEASLLQPRPPKQLTAHAGEILSVNIPIENLGKTNEKIEWGSDSYDYKLLDFQGQTVGYRGANTFSLVGYASECPANSLCQSSIGFGVPLNRMNPRLPLSAGTYTLRVALKNIYFKSSKNDLGVFDIPLTLLP